MQAGTFTEQANPLLGAVRAIESTIQNLLFTQDHSRFAAMARLITLARSLNVEAEPSVNRFLDDDEDDFPRARRKVGGGRMVGMAVNPGMGVFADMDPQDRGLMQLIGPIINAQVDGQLRTSRATELSMLLDLRKKLSKAKAGTTEVDDRIAALKAELSQAPKSPLSQLESMFMPNQLGAGEGIPSPALPNP